jgi:uridine kinase
LLICGNGQALTISLHYRINQESQQLRTAASKERIMDNLLQQVAKWIKAADKKILIGISGHGAAGKTTFTNKLMDLLHDKPVNYVNTDPYIISSTVRKHTVIDYTYQNEPHRYKMTACHPSAHHLPSLERDVRMIREGLDLCTIGTHYRESERISSQNNITIVEGMSAAFVDPALFDLKIYFYTDGETEFWRRSGRDVAERGMDIQYLRQSHAERRIQYEVFMHPYSRNFDIVVKTGKDQTVFEKADFDFK